MDFVVNRFRPVVKIVSGSGGFFVFFKVFVSSV